jgi:hypothetical protein
VLSLRRVDHSSSGVPPSVMRLSVITKFRKREALVQQVLLRHENKTFSENREIRWKNMVQPERPQKTIQYGPCALRAT